MAAASPTLRFVTLTDRRMSGSAESVLMASSRPNGIRPTMPTPGTSSAAPKTTAAAVEPPGCINARIPCEAPLWTGKR